MVLSISVTKIEESCCPNMRPQSSVLALLYEKTDLFEHRLSHV